MWILEPSFGTLETSLCTLALPNINYICVVLFLSQMYRLFIYTIKYVFSHIIYRCNSYNTIFRYGYKKILSWKSVSWAVFSCTADPMNAFSWWQKSVLTWFKGYHTMTSGSESWLRWPLYEQINIHLLPLNDFASHILFILDLENNLPKHIFFNVQRT